MLHIVEILRWSIQDMRMKNHQLIKRERDRERTILMRVPAKEVHTTHKCGRRFVQLCVDAVFFRPLLLEWRENSRIYVKSKLHITHLVSLPMLENLLKRCKMNDGINEKNQKMQCTRTHIWSLSLCLSLSIHNYK